MTREEKAKAYDEALEKAKEIKSKILSSHLSTESCKAVSEYIDTIIPELAESEDERIRKIITDSVFNQYRGPSVEYNDVVDYLDKLEKQKENMEKEYVFRPLAEKAKAYDDAIRKAQDVYHTSEFIKITDLFPEFAESEDERIKNKSGYYKAGKFWRASTLWNAVKGKSPQRVPNRYILQECTWNISSLQHFADEVKNVYEVDLNYPIILDMNGNILDGAHRVVKAYLEGKDVDIVYLGDDEWPEPDYDERIMEGFRAWFEKQKEQKPAEPSDDELQSHQDELYNFKVFATKQAREHHISFVHDFEWNNFCEELLSYFNEKQMPAEWNEKDKEIIGWACCYLGDYAASFKDKNERKSNMLYELSSKLNSLSAKIK